MNANNSQRAASKVGSFTEQKSSASNGQNDTSDSTTKVARKKHRKSRVGCPQCRKRKIKCDEALPSCQRCIHRKVRCGYLDFSQKELDLVRISHWEAAGADLDKYPFKLDHAITKSSSQKIILPSQATAAEIAKSEKASQLLSQTSIQTTHTETQNQSQSYPQAQTIFPLLTSSTSTTNQPVKHSLLRSVLLDPKQAIVNLPQEVELVPRRDSADSSDPSDSTPLTSDSLVDDSLNNANLINASEYGPFSINLVEHEDTLPSAEKVSGSSTFNDTDASLAAIVYVKRLAFTNILYSRYNLSLFFCSIVFGAYGPFLSKHPEFRNSFIRARGYCIHYVLEESRNITDDNVIPLLRTSNNLNCSSIFLNGEIGYKSFFKFSIGPSAILRKVYENPSKFPKSFPAIKVYADANLFTTKFVWVPQYNHKVLYEFLDIMKEFANEYLFNENSPSYNDETLTEQYYSMIGFIELCLDLFENHRSPNLVVRYPIARLYQVIQRWYSIVPSEMFTLSSKTKNVEKVFYVLWYTLLMLMDSFINSCRYIFGFFLDGYYLVDTFNKNELLVGLDDDKLKWFLNYGCRIIAFFERRIAFIIGNTVFNDPIPIFLELKDRLKARPLEINEIFIESFRNTVIKKIHYPSESRKSLGFTNSSELVDYYKSKTTNQDYPHYMTSIDKQNDDLGSMFQEMSELETEDSNDQDVDLINNVNPSTSLLNNDYDPRSTNDPVFNNNNFIVQQEATLTFFDRYIEDRKLIILLGDQIV